jgi:secreted Zn-dependent insulinase-like peptidase
VAEELNYTSDGSAPNVTEDSGGIQFPFPDLDTIELLYRTPFHRKRIPDELLMYWNVVNDGSVSLPASNTFIPDDFSIISKSPNDSNSPAKLSSDNNAVSMWWLLDTNDFHEPRVNLMCQLNNTNTSITPAWDGESNSHTIGS